MFAVLLYVLFVVIGLRFFDPAEVGAVLSVIGLVWLGVVMRKRYRIMDLSVPFLATVVGVTVWVMESELLFKLLPVLISLLFFVKFFHAYQTEQPFLAKMVEKVPKVSLSDGKLAYIDRSHGYWCIITGINLVLQIVMIFAPMGVWALYTTAGWYVLFASALAAQVIYGRVRGI